MRNIGDLPLSGREWWIVTVSSMEQIIGAALSTLVGVIIPMINLTSHAAMPSVLQGLIGAIGLIGIGIGSALVGRLADKEGYLGWFRLCPLIMVAASLCVWLFPSVAMLIAGLFVIGIGVGGGYSLDSSYISELMPAKWRGFMVGLAKASSSLGFIGMALVCYWIIKGDANPHLWPSLMLLIAAMGAVTLLMRIRWWESPVWLMANGKSAAAQKAAQEFFGPGVSVTPPAHEGPQISWLALFKGENLKKVIFSGVPWACEGLGVYGIGVFLPILVMALGIEHEHLEGMAKVSQSVLTTTLINCFILVGFVAGLFIVKKMNQVKMLYIGFLVSALGLGWLLCGYLLKWEAWTMVLGFVVFEVFLNAGPHLITYIVPTQVFGIEERAAGSGIAALLGKVGAILGVFFMPILLHLGGVTLVMATSIIVMLLGALVSAVYGKILKLT